MSKFFSIVILLILVYSSCTPARRTQGSFDHFFNKNQLFSDHFTGFSLYDPVNQKTIYEHNADHFFTPASNTKIITLFSALKTLPDSLPSIKYSAKKDTLYLWGLGDPTTLNPLFGDQDQTISLVAQEKKEILFCKNHFEEDRFGEGWAWDDYPYAYQAEKSSFPVFGNLLHLQYQTANSELVLYPNFCQVGFYQSGKQILSRDEWSNRFDIDWSRLSGTTNVRMPLHMTDTLITKVFAQYRKKPLIITEQCRADEKKILYSLPVDTVYAAMMQHSDNFIAEQLLLVISGYLTDTLQTKIAIRYIKKKYLTSIADQLQWYDGSGLSRYNMFTPRAITAVLTNIYHMLSTEKIKRIFPAGGLSGTIANWYKNEDGPPFIYAKTGTLKSVHCLSGYLFTDSGKTLIFSFMHNNFAGTSSSVKLEMDLVLRHIKANY